MGVSPVNTGAPIIAPSVNSPTEQAARDNRVREKIVPATEIAHSAREKQVTTEEKQLKKPSWDPSEHPDYSQLHEQQLPVNHGYSEDLERLVNLLSTQSYMEGEQGYSMRIKLPREVLEELEKISHSERVKGVVSYHYATATVPNPPTEYIVVV